MSRGAGIGAALSRGPACGDATAEPIMGAWRPILCAPSGSDPLRGPSSALRRAPLGMRPARAVGRRHNACGFGQVVMEAAHVAR